MHTARWMYTVMYRLWEFEMGVARMSYARRDGWVDIRRHVQDV